MNELTLAELEGKIRLIVENDGLSFTRLASLTGLNLKNDLAGADLEGVDLRDASLDGADLRGARLAKANLQGVNLRDANLSEADLSWANLEEADLRGANLALANMQGASLANSDLRNTNLDGAFLADANLDGAQIAEEAISTLRARSLQVSLQRPSGERRRRQPSYVAVIDQSTTSTQCMLFNHSGELVAKQQREHEQIYPQPGWVEHDPMEIWERTQDVIKDVVNSVAVEKGNIAAIGIANQRDTTIVWNPETGQPYYNAIVWQDTRTDRICHQLAKEGGHDRFRAKVGLPLATYFAGPKLMWILENIEGVREAAESGKAFFGTIDTWLIWWLTGGPNGGTHVTDATNASRTMLMNLDTLHWEEEILEIMRIPHQMLPRIVPSSDPQTWGKTRKEGAFGDIIPVAGALGDEQARLVGQTCYGVGDAKNTYGLGCSIMLNIGTRPASSESGLMATLGYKFGDAPAVYALEGSIAVTGALLQWLLDNLGSFEDLHEIERYAKQAEDSGGVYFVPAFSGLFAPYWRSDARGAIVGLTRYVNKGHIARAALEATAFQTREVLDAMQSDSGTELRALKVDGNMTHNELLMQFQADILGVPVVRPIVSETSALGAAYAAGLAVGFWNDLKDLRQNWSVGKTWEPGVTDRERVHLYRGWKKAVARTFDWMPDEG